MPESDGRKFKLYFVWIVLALLVLAELQNIQSGPPQTEPDFLYKPAEISEKARNHILYGDHSGGGHKHGTAKPCKSEFPADWNDQKIIDTVQKIAANDNLQWKQQENGYYVTENYDDNVKIRVVIGRQKKHVITAYPLNTGRNPCHTNDN